VILAVAFFSTEPGSCGAQELFHSGGTGNCEGCHATRGGYSGGQSFSLIGSDASSTCLTCHEAPPANVVPQEHYIATASQDLQGGLPAQMTPAGDFGWLKKSYSWRGEGGAAEQNPGERHGHNIVAADYGYSASTGVTSAPGGSYPAANLSCVSCHDPHGNYRRNGDGSITTSGNKVVASGSYNNSPNPDSATSVGSYRLLAGKGYRLKSIAGGPDFVADPPAAVAPASYNRGEAKSDTRVAYGSGMSEWCQNCHPKIHSAGGQQHVSGNDAKFDIDIVSNYNNYVRSGNLNGSAQSSYTSLVPYEMGTDDYATLKGTANSDGSNSSGPGFSGGRPNVMCLSCHRAHASGWDSMTRWNVRATFIVQDGVYPGIDNRAKSENAQGRTEAEARRAYYDRPASVFSAYQRSLCNKCHAKD
jgi:hypothetical protein